MKRKHKVWMSRRAKRANRNTITLHLGQQPYVGRIWRTRARKWVIGPKMLWKANEPPSGGP